MKKLWQKYNYPILVTVIFSIGAFLRLYNFENRLIFGPEQAISLTNSAANLEKFSLLGEFNLQRTTSTGLNLIHGPLFSYFLLPFIILFDYRVLPISFVFPLLNLLTAFILLIASSKLFGKVVGLFSFAFFLFSSLMIYHSMFIWIYNPLPLLGVITLWLTAKLIQNRSSVSIVFWLGLISGIGFSLQYPYLVFAFVIYLLILYLSSKKLISFFVYPLGFILANITRVIFDLRHDFFHLRVLWEFFLDVYVRHTVTASAYYYHYLHLFPLFCLLLAILAAGIYRLNRYFSIVVVAVYAILNLQSSLLNLAKATGMPNDITLKTLESIALVINQDNPPQRFNLVTLWDFDTLARPLRYLLKSYYHKSAQPFENYANVDTIYAFAPLDYDIGHPGVWELKTYMPYVVSRLESPSEKYVLYKLTK